MNTEKFLVFLISTAFCAIGLLVAYVFFHKFFILGNMQLSRAMAVVFLSFILNGMILAACKTVPVVSADKRQGVRLFVSFVVILVTVIIYSMFAQITGLKLVNFWGGLVVAFVVTVIEFLTSKYALVILNKNF